MGTAGSQRAIDAVRHLGATTVKATRAWAPLAKELQTGADMASAEDTAVEAEAHRSIFVPGELHLGTVDDCRHCRPFINEERAT